MNDTPISFRIFLFFQITTNLSRDEENKIQSIGKKRLFSEGLFL